MLFAKLLILWYGFVMTVPLSYQQQTQRVSKEGMNFSWKHVGKKLICEVESPGAGWLAIGLNPESGLDNTQLIMACVDGNEVHAEEFWVFEAGDFRPLSAIGGELGVEVLEGSEGDFGSKVRLSLVVDAIDSYHYPIWKGRKFHLLLAYAESDDFLHHSFMRTSAEIRL